MTAPTRRHRRDTTTQHPPVSGPQPPTNRPADLDHDSNSGTRSQRTARELQAAEEALVDAHRRLVAARQAWAEQMRLSGRGEAGEAEVLTAQAQIEAAEATQVHVEGRIEELRRRLHDERRRELLADAVAGQAVAHEDARRRADEHARMRSFFERIFGRRKPG